MAWTTVGVAEARGSGQGGWVLMLEHPMSRHSPSSGGSCELDPLPAEICAAADWGAWAAGRLLPAGHPSLWSFPSYSRTLTPWAIAARRLKPSHALQSAALSRPAGCVKDSDVCPLPMALSPFTSLAFSCMCEAQGMDGECVPPTPPGAQAVSISGLFPLVGPVSDLPIEMGFPARREQLGGPGEPLGSDKEL